MSRRGRVRWTDALRARAAWLEVWRGVADAHGGRVIERKLHPPRIELPHGPWRTLADTTSDPSGSGSTLTRLRTAYRVGTPFRMRIRKRGPFGGFARWFAADRIRVGRSEFDRRFTVRSDRRGVARSLLLGTRLGELLLERSDAKIDLSRPGRRRRRELGEGMHDAVVVFPRILVERDDLLGAFELSWELVGELARVGVARPGADGEG